MKADFFSEPELEFGSGRHVDIRFGIMNHGPLDVGADTAPSKIQVGIVGTPETVEIMTEWLDACRSEVPARESNQPNLFPKFPGFNPDCAFHSELQIDSTLQRTIAPKVLDELKRAQSDNEFISQASQLFLNEFEYLASNTGAQVFLCAVPPQLADLIDPAQRRAPSEAPINFRGLLKAKGMHLKPVQLVLPSTADPNKARKMKIKKEQVKKVQDEATRAWNLHTALYYKAHGRPWRLPRDLAKIATCYVGISFYYSVDRSSVLTSMAQIFDELGSGVVVRGSPVQLTKKDKTPHLSAEDAESLLKEALARYRKTHKTFPGRIVVHKTSPFNDAELEGLRSAAGAEAINTVDCVSLAEDSGHRLFRYGAYPPLRGTYAELDEKHHLLYTRGSVDFFNTYPGMYVPHPLLIRCDAIEETPKTIAREILALSKMNWNQTQFDGALPITMLGARKVGEVLKYIEPEGDVAERYAHYM